MLPADLSRLNARELKIALIIARREAAEGNRREQLNIDKLLREHRKRGITP
jgi:hypothetical protein